MNAFIINILSADAADFESCESGEGLSPLPERPANSAIADPLVRKQGTERSLRTYAARWVGRLVCAGIIVVSPGDFVLVLTVVEGRWPPPLLQGRRILSPIYLILLTTAELHRESACLASCDP